MGQKVSAALRHRDSDKRPNNHLSTDRSLASSVNSHTTFVARRTARHRSPTLAQMSLEDPHHSPRRIPARDPAQSHQPRRIGIFGGTFDPPHIGHLIVAEIVRDTLGLDEVRLVVANNPWQKTSDRTISDPDLRLRMLHAALDGAPGLTASDVEIALGGPSYSIVTLEHMRSNEPDAEWLLIVGADAAAGLDTWHRADELAGLVEVVVVDRPGGEANPPPPGWRWRRRRRPADRHLLDRPAVACRRGRSIRFLTPEPVAAIIERNGLYRQQR